MTLIHLFDGGYQRVEHECSYPTPDDGQKVEDDVENGGSGIDLDQMCARVGEGATADSFTFVETLMHDLKAQSW